MKLFIEYTRSVHGSEDSHKNDLENIIKWDWFCLLDYILTMYYYYYYY